MVPEFAVGSQFGPFTLVEVMGRGADSVVYRASHPTLGRDVALKIFSDDDDSVAAAALEANCVDNDAIVPAYESGVLDGRAWLAMRCITGVDLHTWMQHTRPSLPDVISIVRQVASALDAIHGSGLAHGDVKPSNILMATGSGRPDRLRAFLVDPIPVDSKRLTIDYAAPERLRGQNADASSDQYALACVAYQCLAGAVPYPAATVSEAITGHLRTSTPSLVTSSADLTTILACALDVVLGSALAVRPSDRFASCGALAAAMDRAEMAAFPPTTYHPQFPEYPAGRPPDTITVGPFAASPLPAPIGVSPNQMPMIDMRPDWAMLTCSSLDYEAMLGGLRDEASVQVERSAKADDADVVDCSVFAPPRIVTNTMVQVLAHLPSQAEQAAAEATEFDAEASRRGVRTLEAPVSHGARLVFDLSIPGLEILEPVQSLVWAGRTAAVQFAVTAPEGLAPRTTIGTVNVSREGVTMGSLKFKMQVSEQSDPSDWGIAGDEATRFKRAFVSYASADRAAVLARVQVLRAAQIEYFQDIDMEPGERWEQQLYKQIDECDLFLLFWSQAAKDSQWVRREVEYALALGDKTPQIRPVVIEGPPAPAPWEELAQLHFDDRLLSMLAAASH